MTNLFVRPFDKERRLIMWSFKKKEKRSIEGAEKNRDLTSVLLEALIGKTFVTKDMAMQIPSIQASVNLIKNVISSLPINLYEKTKDGAKKIDNDERVWLINNDTKGNMTGTQIKKAIVESYLMDKGAYIYIDKVGNKVRSLRFVENTDISIYTNSEPIFKEYHINIRGQEYFPHEFIKVIRDTTDGFTGHSIIEQNPLIFAIAYNSMLFENKLVKKGGNKKGFLTSQKHLSNDAIRELKRAWNNMYSNDNDNVVILNDGMSFQESSNTSVEMQLNENKITNSEECTMLFTLANTLVRGKATETDIKNFVKFCITPILVDIENSLDRDLLLENEKSRLYWAFDTTEINRGSFKDRIEAYKTAVESNIMQIDEIREKEDLPAYGFKFIKLGLDSVLMDVDSKTIYTPNTNKVQDMNNMKEDEKNEN